MHSHLPPFHLQQGDVRHPPPPPHTPEGKGGAADSVARHTTEALAREPPAGPPSPLLITWGRGRVWEGAKSWGDKGKGGL